MTTAKLNVFFDQVFMKKLIRKNTYDQVFMKKLGQIFMAINFQQRVRSVDQKRKILVKYLCKFNAFKSTEYDKIDPNFQEELAKVITEP